MDTNSPRRVPPRPERPEQSPVEKSSGSIWSVLVAALVGTVLFIALGFMLWPVIGVAFGIAILVFLLFFMALAHYVIWGHWLRNAIREEVEEEERLEAERLAARKAQQ